MKTLHLLSHSPFTDQRFASCLRLLGSDDGVMLTGDAVYAVVQNTQANSSLQRTGSAVYVLQEDVQARGLAPGDWISVLDYPAFVALTLAYDKVNSWL